MKRLVGFVACLLWSSGVALAAGVPPYPSFTADTELKAQGMTQLGRVAFAKGRMRSDTVAGEHTMTSFADYETGKMFTLVPPLMGCLEDKIGADAEDPVTAMVGSVKEEALGDETIDGHPTKKVRASSTVEGVTVTSLIWKATDLKDLPIRIVAEDGSFELNYRNVKLGEPDAALLSLLSPPKDCKPNPLGAMMEGMK